MPSKSTSEAEKSDRAKLHQAEEAEEERRTQRETTVDLTGTAENSLTSPSSTIASDTSVGDPTVGAPTVKKKKSGAGRPKDLPRWTFFRHDELEDKSVCLVEGCSTKLKGMNTGNNRLHLMKHPVAKKEFLAMCEKQKAQKEQKGGEKHHQPTLAEMAQARKPYSKENPRQAYDSILEEGGLYVLRSPSMTLNGVEDDSFKDLIYHLDPRAPKPTSKLKGMTEAFLGITAHFADKKTHVRHHLNLSRVSFPPPHKAKNVYELFKQDLKKWGINPEKVSVVMTDNASNMIAAFKLYDKMLEECVTEEDELQKEAMVQRMLDEEEPLEDDEKVDEMAAGFDAFELEVSNLFTEYSRYPCFLHSLQLVVKLFEKSPLIKDVMAKVRAIVSSFGHPHTAVAALMARTGDLKLTSDNTTRWSSPLLMAERMVEIQAAVETIIVVEKLVKVPNLSQGEWLVLKGIVKFLGKFKLITVRMQAEKESTIHKIIPHLKDLLAHLSHMKTLAEELNLGSYGIEDHFFSLIRNMQVDIVGRFGLWLNLEHLTIDHITMVATLLHPALRRLLTEMEQTIAMKGVLQYEKKWNSTVNDDSSGSTNPGD
ncbi:LOW QUALITY PROTEIN: hypothetical protein RvY_16031 [Ramazzottius varieornatus]|uniref:BED-type domain-containing protein n=1 Tax=Ramazzottius varieornatus TaxID=947166 RepID=A0A1D1VX16_RAMVA|nr:LOW QUALITY PROTEIN: hypothetical protein RvY_16031 [Ramazzottius varieornatus]